MLLPNPKLVNVPNELITIFEAKGDTNHQTQTGFLRQPNARGPVRASVCIPTGKTSVASAKHGRVDESKPMVCQ